MDQVKQLICIKWGTKYGPQYVNRLRGMIERNITPPFRLICFTDAVAGLHPDIIVRPLPQLDYEAPRNTPGKWPKSRLWGDLGDITGTVLFLDLDVVIVGNLDGFFSHGDDGDTILATNPRSVKPFEKLGQTSVYRMQVGKLAPLQQIFQADPQGIADQYRYEQRFVTRRAPGGVKFWPKGWVVHFRADCLPAFPMRYWRDPKIPPNARIVIFAGHLNPPDAVAGRWSEADSHRAPMDHLRAAFDGRRRESLPKHLRHYFRPARWVAEKWCE